VADDFPIDEDEAQTFSAFDDVEAAKAIRRLINLDRDEAAADEMCAAMKADIERRRAFLVARDLPLLREYAAARLRGKSKTVKTPGGSLSFRTVNAHLKIKDRAAVLAWAKERAPQLVHTTMTPVEKFEADEVKAYVEKHGEIPPGIEGVPEHEAFTVKPPKGDDHG
jgi:phage host-nuclease inhibitor protein Gam